MSAAAEHGLQAVPPVRAASRLSSRLFWLPTPSNQSPLESALATTVENLRRARGETWRTHSCVPRRDSSRRCAWTVTSANKRREESRRGTHECVRHACADGPPQERCGLDWPRYSRLNRYEANRFHNAFGGWRKSARH